MRELAEKELKRKREEAAELVSTKVLTELYSELACTIAPENGGLRATRKGFVNKVVLGYHNLKANHCRPVALG